MSVLIRGMEMPKSCWDCYFQDCGNCILKNHKVVDKCIIEDRIDDDCPLVPVPPHGRLIDGDAVVREIESFCGTHWTTMEIKRAPTIIPAEEGE